MQTELIKAGNPKGGAQIRDIEVPPNRYGALAVVVYGETDTGETLEPEDLGRIRLMRYSDQWQSETLDFYHSYNDIKGGRPRRMNPTAGDSRITSFITPSLPGIPNSWDVRTRDEMQLFIDFDPVLDDRFGANPATYEVRGLIQPAVPETYGLFVMEQDIDSQGAGPRNGSFHARNIGAIYLRDSDDVVSRIHIEIDDTVVTGSVDDEFLLDVTNLIGRVEVSGQDLVEVYSISSGLIEEAINENTQYELQFSGTGRAEVTLFAITRDVDAEGSKQRVRSYLAEKFGGTLPAGLRENGMPAGAVPA